MQHKDPLPIIDIRQVDRPVRVDHVAGQVRPVPREQRAQVNDGPAVHQDDGADVVAALPEPA